MKKLGFIMLLGILMASLSNSPVWAATSDQEGTGDYFDDSVITTKVKSAILNDSKLKVNDISVKTSRGVVRLRGYVTSQAKVDEAIKDSIGVAGVKSVKNELHIKNMAPGKVSKPAESQTGY